MLDRLVHRQPLRRRLLAGDDHVHIVAAAQAVVGDREQAVRVGRQIDAHHLGLLVDDVVDEARILVAEAVMVLPPDMARQQIVQRGDRPPPLDVIAHLQPLGVLVEHRVDDVDERLVAGKEPVATGEQVALEPSLALMLAEHLHHPAIRSKVVIPGFDFRDPRAVGDLENVLPAVGVALVGAEQAEVLRLHVPLHHVAQEPAHLAGGFGDRRTRRRHLDRIVAEIRQAQVAQQQAAVGVRVGAHAAGASGREFGQLRPQSSAIVEQFRWPIALHPLFKNADVLRVLVHLAHRHLMRSPVTLGPAAVDFLRARPSLGRAQHDHRPERSLGEAVLARVLLDPAYLVEDAIEGGRHEFVHRRPGSWPSTKCGVYP